MENRTWSEFEVIRHFFSAIQNHLPAGVVTGIGDDAAVLSIKNTQPTLITHDMMVEDVHFKASWMSPFALARKLTKVNVSDIAAMGGTPNYALLSIALPDTLAPGWLESFSDGLQVTFREFNLSLIGGDTSLSPGPVMVAMTLLGTCKDGSPLLRHTPKTHETIYVTGTLGDAALGLAILNREKARTLRSESDVFYLVQRHLDPSPRLKIGQEIAAKHLATSMIDISDGLIADLGHLLEESPLGAQIHFEDIPLSAAFTHLASQVHSSSDTLILSGGEDYELLFTSPYNAQQLADHAPEIASRVTAIGVVTETSGIKVLKNGKPIKLKTGGYQHQFYQKG